MFEKLEEEIEVKADEYALKESTACDYGDASKHVYQGYFYGFKEGARYTRNRSLQKVLMVTKETIIPKLFCIVLLPKERKLKSTAITERKTAIWLK